MGEHTLSLLLATRMVTTIGQIQEFQSHKGYSSHVERVQLFFTVNDIEGRKQESCSIPQHGKQENLLSTAGCS